MKETNDTQSAAHESIDSLQNKARRILLKDIINLHHTESPEKLAKAYLDFEQACALFRNNLP